MRRRSLGLALLSLALVLPATGRRQRRRGEAKAAAADPSKVLVVTSTRTRSPPRVSPRSTRRQPEARSRSPPRRRLRRRGVHAREPRDLPRGRVPEHGHGEPADRRAARELRGVLPQGRRLRRHRLGDRDRPGVVVPDRASSAPARRAGPASQIGHGQGLRPRPRRDARTCREYWDRTDDLVQLLDATSAASRTSSRRSSRIRSARSRRATRSTASPAARWAPTTRSPSARTTRAAARSTPALGNTAASVRRDADRRTSRARSTGPPARATRSTATAARPC